MVNDKAVGERQVHEELDSLSAEEAVNTDADGAADPNAGNMPPQDSVIIVPENSRFNTVLY